MAMEKLSLDTDVVTSFPLSCCLPYQQHQHQQQKQQQQQQQRQHVICKKSVVSFSEVLNVCSIPSSLDQIDSIREIKSQLWYSRNDMIRMRVNAKRQCEHMKRYIQQQKNESSKKVSLLSLLSITQSSNLKFLSSKLTLSFDDSSTRGLEYMICNERQKRRYVTIRLIVEMSSKIINKNQKLQQQQQDYEENDYVLLLANASIKCTQYASDLAIEEALRDYHRAYHDDEELNVYKNNDPLRIQSSVPLNSIIYQQTNNNNCTNTNTKRRRMNDDEIIILNHNSSSFHRNNNICIDNIRRNVRSRLF